jgi:hypothetical protein
MGGQDSLVDKALDYRPKGTGFDPRLDHKRRSTWATESFSMWDKDLLTIDDRIWLSAPHKQLIKSLNSM